MNTVDDGGHLGILSICCGQNNVFDVAIGIPSDVAAYERRFGIDVMGSCLVQEVNRLVIGHRRGIDVGIADGGLHCYSMYESASGDYSRATLKVVRKGER